MEENRDARTVSPYSMKSVRRSLGRKRFRELMILFVFM